MPEPRLCVLVTGGSRGLGQAIVSDLLRAGHAVATLSRASTPFVASHQAKDPEGRSFVWSAVDIANPAALATFVADVERRFSRLDVLINNAAVAEDGVLPLAHPEAIHRMVSVNLEAAIHLARLCTRAMLRGKGGHIVNISSVTGLRGSSGVAVYGATKGGLDALTRGLARELGPRGIRVNSVAPGYLDTELSRSLSAEQRQRIARRTPLGRLGTVEDVVGVVRFLLSPAATFITGHTLVVDGGMTC
jgi:3-oxoacyl-[acyl-carrier protein] reductase